MKIHGFKTYLAAGALLLYAIGAFAAGKIDFDQALVEVLAALSLMGLRHGMSKLVDVVEE